MTIDEAIDRYTSNAEYERTHGNLQGCLEFRQLAEWLKELKTYRETQVTDAVDRVTIKEYLESFKDTNVVTKENNNEQMEFPDTWEEFEEYYGFYDMEEVYTNGSRLIQSFRVKQWLEHQMTAESRMSYVQEAVNAIMNTCNTDSITDKAMRNAAKFVQNAIDGSYPDFEKLEQEPCGDCVSRAEVFAIAWDSCLDLESDEDTKKFCDKIKALPPVTPQQEPCEDAISRQAVIDMTGLSEWFDSSDSYNEFVIALNELPPVTPKAETVTEFADRCRECGAKYGKLLKQEPKTGYISIDDAMAAFDDFMCNDIEPEGQEVFLELLKDMAERSKE